MSDFAKFWPVPWRFEEQGYSDGPCVKAADGQVIATLFWPLHPPEQTETAEQATYALGRAIAVLTAASRSLTPLPEEVREMVKRLRESGKRVSAMCAERRGPRMTIPADPERDDDLFICRTVDDAADMLERLGAAGGGRG